MSLKDSMETRLEAARMRVEEIRGRYFSVSAKVVEQGSDRLAGLTRLTGLLGPDLRETINQRISDVQSWLDELNQSLAEKAIPADRRAKVGQLAGQTRNPLRVVQGGAGQGPEAQDVKEAPPASANDDAEPPKAKVLKAAKPTRKSTQAGKSGSTSTAKKKSATAARKGQKGGGNKSPKRS
ncbi:hypothetical protein QQM79_19555 [Marinobacteraceae bacterium S3BR75-40.1]